MEVEKPKIINTREDKQDTLWEVIFPISNYAIAYYVYASNLELALELLVAYMEETGSGNIFTIEETRERFMDTFNWTGEEADNFIDKIRITLCGRNYARGKPTVLCALSARKSNGSRRGKENKKSSRSGRKSIAILVANKKMRYLLQKKQGARHLIFYWFLLLSIIKKKIKWK